MTRQTQHLAVLFADISDSTGLYCTLGDNAARAVVDACLTLITHVVERYRGRVVKTIGDEVMCVFQRSDDAVLAAVEMQSSIDAGRPGNYRVRIHIGLHYGPVLVEDDDVFGDTVNAAAYLTAVAAAEQILTTEATARNLSAGLKANVRPVFRAVLKGSTAESTVYQVVWNPDTSELTDINLRLHKVIPGDEGSLLLVHGDLKLSLNQKRPRIMMGRGAECDIVIKEKFASRQHASIRLVRTHFYLHDCSLNGTFVALDGGKEVHVLRGELLLNGSGKLTFGCSAPDGAAETVVFTRDRRAIYRV